MRTRGRRTRWQRSVVGALGGALARRHRGVADALPSLRHHDAPEMSQRALLAEDLLHGEAIFPGGRLPAVEDIEKLAADSGFTLERVHLLQPHYARTLDMWAENLEKNKDAALAMQGQEVYDRYMHYLTGCADFFHRGVTNVGQFTLQK